MYVSSKFIDILRYKYEGCVLHPYDDKDASRLTYVRGEWRRVDGAICLGWPTIGIGHVIRDNEPRYTEITLDTAIRLCRSDVTWVEETVRRQCPSVTDQNQFDALCLFTFNCGSGGLTKSGIPLAIKEGRSPEKEWNSYGLTTKGVLSKVLVDRRAAEFRLYHTGEIDIDETLASVAVTTRETLETLPELSGHTHREED